MVSTKTATISLIISTLFGAPLGHVLARSRGRFGTVAGVAVQLPLALPPIMSGILLIYLIGPYSFLGRHFGGHLTPNSLTGIVITQTFVSAPFVVVAAAVGLRGRRSFSRRPGSTLGHRPLADLCLAYQSARRLAGIRAGMVLTWLRAFGEYGAVSSWPTTRLACRSIRSSRVFGHRAPGHAGADISGAVLRRRRHPHQPRGLVASASPKVGSDRRRPRSRQGHADRHGLQLDTHVGTFHLQVAYQATGHRIAIVGAFRFGQIRSASSPRAGLVARAGTVHYGREDVSNIAPEDRRIGYVPQGLALIPGRTVWQRPSSPSMPSQARAAWWLETLHLEQLLYRLPTQLSGGQRQRVSLA